MDKRRNCSSGAISPLFHNSFNIHCILCKGVKLRILGIWLLDFFLNSGNLICRSTGISMYFRESLGVRDNESRLYLFLSLNETMPRVWWGWCRREEGTRVGGGSNANAYSLM